MHVGVFDLYRVGPGPSSTYTVAPQRAALRFAHALAADGVLPAVDHVEVELHGSLAFLGREHATEAAIVAGLAGEMPEHCNAASLTRCLGHAELHGMVAVGGRHAVRFKPARDIRRAVRTSLAGDGNAVRFVAHDLSGTRVASRLYFALCGGGVLESTDLQPAMLRREPYPFASAVELADVCRSRGKRIQDVALVNATSTASPDEVRARLAHAAQAMCLSVERGLANEGVLPSGRPRTAGDRARRDGAAATSAMRCSVLAIAVGEENAAGGTIVTAPSAGAAGPVAALLYHWREGGPWKMEERTTEFLLAAAAVGSVLRAMGVMQVGCQGEIGVGAAMAAAGLAAVNDASCDQVLFAAERALEPHLGLACDLVSGHIDDPCIARGARAAALACEAAAIALRVPRPRVGLDTVAHAMVASGRSLSSRPKNASIGGLAVNVVEC